MRQFDLVVFADYHQFYIWDGGMTPRAPDYSDDDVERMVKVAPNVVVIMPVRNMDVPVQLRLHNAEPRVDLAGWDHVVECSLGLPTGRLQVYECTGSAKLDTSVEPGTYCVRAMYSGLDTLSVDGLEGDDRYVVELWPGEQRAVETIKRWSRSSWTR